jgi:cytochrome c553
MKSVALTLLCAAAVLVDVSVATGVLAAPQTGAPEKLRAVLSAVPDAKRGARLYRACAACHGLRAEGSAEQWTPALAGQHRRFLAKEPVDYRYGIRWDFRMERVAASHVLPFAQDIADISAYLGRLQPERTDSLGDGVWIAQGRQRYGRLCVSCHRLDGAGNGARFVPRLSGQRYDYLLRQLHDVVDGRRPNMARIHDLLLRKLDMEELQGLADYLSRFPTASGNDSPRKGPPTFSEVRQ